MAANETRPPRLVPGNGLADVHCSAAIDSREDSANRPARQVRTPAPSILSIDGAALAAVLRTRSLRAAHAAARDGLDALAAAAPCDVLKVDEAAELSGRTPSTVRRWAASHRLGRRLGGRWLLSRTRFRAFIAGGA